MKNYLLNRLFVIIPTTVVAILLIFLLKKNLPNNGLPCELDKISLNQLGESNSFCLKQLYAWGYDKPSFYFTISSKAFPNSYFQIINPTDQQTIKDLILIGYQGETVINSYKKEGIIPVDLSSFSKNQPIDFFIPTIHWNGSQNQFHFWIKQIITFDFGVSHIDNQSVLKKIGTAFIISFQLTLISLILIFVGTYFFAMLPFYINSSKFERIYESILVIMIKIPSFIIAMVLLILFTSSEYSKWMDWFPGGGIGKYEHDSIFDFIIDRIWHFTLPIFSLIIIEISYLSLHLYKGIKKELNKEYIKYAKTRMATAQNLIKNHALPIAVTPLISLISNILPAFITGDILIEVIYGIPGIGQLFFTSLSQNDWPIVLCILVFSTIATSLSYLLSDLFLYLHDPTIEFQKI